MGRDLSGYGAARKRPVPGSANGIPALLEAPASPKMGDSQGPIGGDWFSKTGHGSDRSGHQHRGPTERSPERFLEEEGLWAGEVRVPHVGPQTVVTLELTDSTAGTPSCMFGAKGPLPGLWKLFPGGPLDCRAWQLPAGQEAAVPDGIPEQGLALCARVEVGPGQHRAEPGQLTTGQLPQEEGVVAKGADVLPDRPPAARESLPLSASLASISAGSPGDSGSSTGDPDSPWKSEWPGWELRSPERLLQGLGHSPLWLELPPSGAVFRTEGGVWPRPGQIPTSPELLPSRAGISGHSRVDEDPLEGCSQAGALGVARVGLQKAPVPLPAPPLLPWMDGVGLAAGAPGVSHQGGVRGIQAWSKVSEPSLPRVDLLPELCLLGGPLGGPLGSLQGPSSPTLPGPAPHVTPPGPSGTGSRVRSALCLDGARPPELRLELEFPCSAAFAAGAGGGLCLGMWPGSVWDKPRRVPGVAAVPGERGDEEAEAQRVFVTGHVHPVAGGSGSLDLCLRDLSLTFGHCLSSFWGWTCRRGLFQPRASEQGPGSSALPRQSHQGPGDLASPSALPGPPGTVTGVPAGLSLLRGLLLAAVPKVPFQAPHPVPFVKREHETSPPEPVGPEPCVATPVQPAFISPPGRDVGNSPGLSGMPTYKTHAPSAEVLLGFGASTAPPEDPGPSPHLPPDPGGPGRSGPGLLQQGLQPQEAAACSFWGPEGQAGCRHLAALSEGSAVDKMTSPAQPQPPNAACERVSRTGGRPAAVSEQSQQEIKMLPPRKGQLWSLTRGVVRPELTPGVPELLSTVPALHGSPSGEATPGPGFGVRPEMSLSLAPWVTLNLSLFIQKVGLKGPLCLRELGEALGKCLQAAGPVPLQAASPRPAPSGAWGDKTGSGEGAAVTVRRELSGEQASSG
uniref:collagen alpha-1(I) chain-like n=1 Tax=Panthera onca TaxID=9690 RepID=UPI002955C4B8|nr:collagen alpha-1(I) chain-like [Panthera onca]